ncbi:putative membrane protein [Escherichia coli MP020940.1]|nr:putative membrane protein [Escherichia coli MP021552.12]EMV81617.1 putative membrane protein [Escherichia coli 2865200]EMW38602.1 putative membrane protein [Escherichia coli 2788150]EMX28003.1 putative membrane protein [Escherichia coli MP021561.2]EMX33265.1 putative membrane protein [Escherichia coli MP021552.8]EMX58295.1 putative membrane protein [Escherichia coli MP020940.1]EMZ91753.1 putative membrane protein [Escherichia coli P0304816.1]ENC27334.1 putative membrane protein [Escherich
MFVFVFICIVCFVFLNSIKHQIYFSLRFGIIIFDVFVGFCPLMGCIFG